MKPQYEKITYDAESSIYCHHIQATRFLAPWHFHPEYELVCILSSWGKRFVGDHAEPFAKNDLILLGPNLPHVWLNDAEFFPNSHSKAAQAIVVQFDDSRFPEGPEFRPIQQMLKQSALGLKFHPSFAKTLLHDLESLLGLPPLDRYVLFLRIMKQLSLAETASLATLGYSNKSQLPRRPKIEKGIRFIVNHYHEPISLKDVAAHCCMNSSAFSRLFKQCTHKTCIEYVHEVRIAYAKKLLIENGLSVSQVGFECGFQNLSNFNRIFKRLTNQTPLDYRKQAAIMASVNREDSF